MSRRKRPRRRSSQAARPKTGAALVVLVAIVGGAVGLIGSHQDHALPSPAPAPTPSIQSLYTSPSTPIGGGAQHPIVSNPEPAPPIAPAPSRIERRSPGPQLLKRNQECGIAEYRNVDGMCIHRPYDSPHGGETAICRDGTHSMSAHHRGTCSHHGGVAVWE